MEQVHFHESQKPTNYLALSIIGTLLSCCSPYCIGVFIGIAAIYYASRVNGLFYQNRFADAEEASKYAKILSFIALGLGIIGMIYAGYEIKTNPELLNESQRAVDEFMRGYNEGRN